MGYLDPDNTTVNDICTAALQEAGVVGIGQVPVGVELLDAQARLQWMLQQWAHKRYLVYGNLILSKTSTGANSYTVGDGGDFDTGPGSGRPDKIEAAFLRQLVTTQANQVDYPLELIQSQEDYSRIALKGLKSFPSYVFYDPTFPLGTLRAYPVAQNAIYGLNIVVKQQLPLQFAALTTVVALPYEYFWAIVTNLALALMNKYGMRLSPGNTLPTRAKDGLAVLRGGNTAISTLQIPSQLRGGGRYNIFSDK
jgi:hypothetical protein